MTNHEIYMEKALQEAMLAFQIDEVPIGCVIVTEDRIIGAGFNMRSTKKNTLYHAELIAIHKACQSIGDWRLEGCTLYATVEPCPMCAGAIVQARVKEVVFGARNPKAGSCGSVVNLLNQPGYNHQVSVIEGVLEDKCAGLMKVFFKKFRTTP